MILFQVCIAGYFKTGDSCTMCTGNTIKPLAGNTTSCEGKCDAGTTEASEDHTTCGEFLVKNMPETYFLNIYNVVYSWLDFSGGDTFVPLEEIFIQLCNNLLVNS